MKSDKKQVIYMITNILNNKTYVGSAMIYGRRVKDHLRLLDKGTHHSKHLQNSYDKHGKDVFEFKILEEVDDVSELINTEQKWMDSVNPEFNMTKIAGLNSHLGMKRSDETKRKISEALTGRKLSEGHIEAMRQSLIGNKHSQETIDKRVESCLTSESFQRATKSKSRRDKIKKTRLENGGYIVTDEMKRRISETLKSKNLQSAISKGVSQYSLDGDLLMEYPSLTKAENDNNITNGYLSKRLNRGFSVVKGYIWKLKINE